MLPSSWNFAIYFLSSTLPLFPHLFLYVPSLFSLPLFYFPFTLPPFSNSLFSVLKFSFLLRRFAISPLFLTSLGILPFSLSLLSSLSFVPISNSPWNFAFSPPIPHFSTPSFFLTLTFLPLSFFSPSHFLFLTLSFFPVSNSRSSPLKNFTPIYMHA